MATRAETLPDGLGDAAETAPDHGRPRAHPLTGVVEAEEREVGGIVKGRRNGRDLTAKAAEVIVEVEAQARSLPGSTCESLRTRQLRSCAASTTPRHWARSSIPTEGADIVRWQEPATTIGRAPNGLHSVPATLNLDTRLQGDQQSQVRVARDPPLCQQGASAGRLGGQTRQLLAPAAIVSAT